MKIGMKVIANNKVLAGAIAGKTVFVDLIRQTDAEPLEPAALILDFAGIDVATASFLRETVFALKTYMRARQSKLYPVVANLNNEIRDELSVLTEAMNDVIISCVTDDVGIPSDVRLIGKLDPKQKLVFDFITKNRIADANTLKQKLGDSEKNKTTNVWNNRLAGLVARGVVREFSIGRTKFYKAILDEVE